MLNSRVFCFGGSDAEQIAFLVKTVQVPQESLEHDLVFKMGQQCAERFRGQLITDNNGRRTVPGKVFVPVIIRLSAGKSHDLCRNICTELLLAG